MPPVGAHVNINPTIAWIAWGRAKMMPTAAWPRILAGVFCVVGCTGATAAPATAIFPFEIYDTSGEPPRSDLTERLAMATRVLSEALEKTGRYSPIDLGPFNADVAAIRLRLTSTASASWFGIGSRPMLHRAMTQL